MVRIIVRIRAVAVNYKPRKWKMQWDPTSACKQL